MMLCHTSFGGTVIRRASVDDGWFTETSHAPLSTLAAHAHARASLCFVVAGEFEEEDPSRAMVVGPDDVIFRRAGKWHSNQFLQRGARCFNVELSDELLGDVRSFELANRPVVAGLLRKMRRELRQGIDAPLILEGLLYQIVGEAFQRSARERTPRWIAEVDAILVQRFSEKLTVRSIAAEVGIHPVHLARAFRAARGITIADTLFARRIEEATRLLQHSTLPLCEVAQASGFADQSHFTKAFRRATGTTPLRFRRCQIPVTRTTSSNVVTPSASLRRAD